MDQTHAIALGDFAGVTLPGTWGVYHNPGEYPSSIHSSLYITVTTSWSASRDHSARGRRGQ